MRASGILMPVFSLPGPFGIGTLGKEAFAFVDFLADAKQTYWQILPIGPTGYGDSPYQSFSAFAGNPYFIDYRLLAADGLLTADEIPAEKPVGSVDYGALYNERPVILKKAADRLLAAFSPAYKAFCKEQDKDKVCVWVYSLFTDVPGDYVKKPMKECTGKEITEEWLYHLGVPVDQIPELAENSAVCVPTMMPYITAFFMPRRKGDRPDVIPDGCVNFAFLGQFAETPRDTIFTTEYSVRTAMEAVYGLLGVDRGVPEVWGSVYDIRDLLDSSVKLMDGKSPLEIELPGPLNLLKKPLLKLVDGNVVGDLLKEHGIIKEDMVK